MSGIPGSPPGPVPGPAEPGLLQPAAPGGRAPVVPGGLAGALFAGRSPRELLSLLGEGDPLHLFGRAAASVRAAARLLEVDRVHRRALARVALAAPLYGGEPELGSWIGARVEEAMEDLLRADREELRQGNAVLEPWDPRFAFLTQSFGIPPGSTLRASVAFNSLGPAVRRAFFRVVVEGKSVERCLAEGLGPRDDLRERCRAAFRALFGEDREESPCARIVP